jgi:RND family efflux transporter MFP subunit
MKPFYALATVWIALCLSLPAVSLASVDVEAGPYRVKLQTQPTIVPVGSAKVALEITDASGKELDGLEVRAIARMPGMFMGEREQRANPVPGDAGAYQFQGAFPMAGPYEVQIKINGPQGASTAIVPLRTGQDTGAATGGFSVLSLVPWLLGIALIAFVAYRMRATGQRANFRSAFTKGTVGGVLLLAVLLAISVYAVNNWRRQGAMTPIEAQVMEMNTPAPAGTSAVQLATVRRGPIGETASYSGQVVGFVEQDVNARVTGAIVWMPYYVGDKVKKGQVLARLDTSQLDPELAERAAMTNMAAEGVGVAASEYQAALQEVIEARAEVGVKESGVSEAEAMLDAARQDKAAMEADVSAMQSDVANAQAEISSAQENARFWTDELGRMRQLFGQGAISKSELQQAESEAADAQANLRQAQAMLRNAESKVAAAKANVKKSEAMVSAAQRRIRMAQAEVRAARAAVVSRQKAAEAAKKNISRERAGVAQARAGYQSASAQRSYSELKSGVDGVITARAIDPGTLVNPGQTVLKVAQISPIRLQANVAGADLERIQVGTQVTVLPRSENSVPIQAKVTSISPAVDPQSRTGVVEVVWPNADGRFLPGQFVTMQIHVGAIREALFIPSEAVQRSAGAPGAAKTFVWLAKPTGEPGRFTVERKDVQIGSSDGKNVAILSGLSEGQQVVTMGGAYLREGGEVAAPVSETRAKGPVVEVFASGFKPESVTVSKGEPVTITFIRRSEEGCGTEIVFPELDIDKPLPLNEPVEVELRPDKTGELKFSCGMDMLRGKVIVR